MVVVLGPGAFGPAAGQAHPGRRALGPHDDAPVLRLEHLSPLDRSVIASAVREIAAVQRRMDNLAVWLPAEEWAVS